MQARTFRLRGRASAKADMMKPTIAIWQEQAGKYKRKQAGGTIPEGGRLLTCDVCIVYVRMCTKRAFMRSSSCASYLLVVMSSFASISSPR